MKFSRIKFYFQKSSNFLDELSPERDRCLKSDTVVWEMTPSGYELLGESVDDADNFELCKVVKSDEIKKEDEIKNQNEEEKHQKEAKLHSPEVSMFQETVFYDLFGSDRSEAKYSE